MKKAATAFDLTYHMIYTVYKDFLTNRKHFREKQEVFKGKERNEGRIAFIHIQLDVNTTLNLKEIQKLIELEIHIFISTIANYIKLFHFSFKIIQKIAHSVTTLKIYKTEVIIPCVFF